MATTRKIIATELRNFTYKYMKFVMYVHKFENAVQINIIENDSSETVFKGELTSMNEFSSIEEKVFEALEEFVVENLSEIDKVYMSAIGMIK